MSFFLTVAIACATVAMPPAIAQTNPAPAPDPLNSNPPPFDFNDAFYTANGIDVKQLDLPAAQRFGLYRQTGPPAAAGQMNWVMDPANTDPDRNSVRILATTGGYQDDTASPTQFINIIAFLNSQNLFTGLPNARGLTTQSIVANFEAYGALRQIVNGVFQPTPCASIGDPNLVAQGNCFPVNSVATPNLRQDWRFATNRNAIDGSDPLAYFGDDLLGMWIITYFWYTDSGFGPKQTPQCHMLMDALGQMNGLSLDGTPIIKSGQELNFMEGRAGVASPIPGIPDSMSPTPGCAAEGNLDAGGADGGAVWLICPSLPDARGGAITPDAFADVIHKPDGSPLDPQITANFQCLQTTGNFCPLQNGTYTVQNNVSGLVWDGNGASTANQVQLNLLNSPDQGTKQLWMFTSNSDGTYTITNASSGMVLDSGSTTVSGSAVIQSASSGKASQRWTVTHLTDGYRIANAASSLSIDATSNVPAQGASITQATPDGETAQTWIIY